ncbi:MAG: tRNA (N6-threonylcarbamoyladenosine(37)-N6)-methyltransferase TrmO [Eubacteriales bacterium]|nr:tRNA (N6-threonylcarbamoyladenosine(37)-N6)-methyltransferase TrmO [Eubacteriales bacterium]
MCCSDREKDLLRLRPVARIHTDFKEKFGIPRQPGLVEGLTGTIEFLDEFRNPDVIRGIEDFEYLWLIFGFSRNWQEDERGNSVPKWSGLVRPPRLGGKEKKGVFATRSPFRPSGLGLSSVKLLDVQTDKSGHPLLIVGGADLLDGTPIYDIKPYSEYSDSHPGAGSGFSVPDRKFLEVEFPENLMNQVAEEKRKPLLGVLEQDPRAAYEKKPDYVYGLRFAEYDVRFRVEGEILTVTDVQNEEMLQSGGVEKVK